MYDVRVDGGSCLRIDALLGVAGLEDVGTPLGKGGTGGMSSVVAVGARLAPKDMERLVRSGKESKREREALLTGAFGTGGGMSEER